MSSIRVNSLGPPLASAVDFLRQTTPSCTKPPLNETPLLKKIRIALRGADAEDTSAIYTDFRDPGECPNATELSWSGHTAVLSRGGVIVRKWSFVLEEEDIQWACFGVLQQFALETRSGHTSANYATEEPVPPAFTNGRPTFGPFTRANLNAKPDTGKPEDAPAVFIFLRSTAKIYLHNGVDYTFSLPFIVRKAWPVHPYGVMVQRVLDPNEIMEATNNDDIPLPTIFSITNPFSEAAVVGLTSGILGPTREFSEDLKDKDEYLRNPLKSIPPTEMIVSVSTRSQAGDLRAVVTVDPDQNLLSVWHYIHLKPKDTPVPLDATQSEARTAHKKRHSTSGLGNRRTSAMFDEPRNRHNPLSPNLGSQELAGTQLVEFPESSEMPPLSSLPGMRPALSSTTTMASLVSGTIPSQQSAHMKGHRSSLSRNELSMNMDRMALGARFESDAIPGPMEDGRMKAAYWMEKLLTFQLEKEDTERWRDITVSLFDDRFDGTRRRCLMSILLPASNKLLVYAFSQHEDRRMQINLVTELPARAAVSLRATRDKIWDLLVVKPSGDLALLTHGVAEIPIALNEPEPMRLYPATSGCATQPIHHGSIIGLQPYLLGTCVLRYQDGWRSRVNFDIYPQDKLTNQCLQVLALILPPDLAFGVHRKFLESWSTHAWSTTPDVEFECLSTALDDVFGLQTQVDPSPSDPWRRLRDSPSHARLREDPALRNLRLPPSIPPRHLIQSNQPPHPLLAPVVYGLHILGESLRLLIHRHQDVLRFAPLICRLAMGVRPEWADYWKRLVPDAMMDWPSPPTLDWSHYEDKMPVWPVDIASVLHSRLRSPDWKAPWQDMQHIVNRFNITPSLFYGICDPLQDLHKLSLLYNTLADPNVPETQKRAENAMYGMVSFGSPDFMQQLPLGIASPLREAARTCQLLPPGTWPLEAYAAIGRNDLAASANHNQEIAYSDGYGSRKDYLDQKRPREPIGEIIAETRFEAACETDNTSGVELNCREFTDVRFGQDRRLEEVSRILCSATVPSVKSMDRPEISEHDQAKEHQNQAIRIAERTLALPYGRAMFTYGSVPIVTREAYNIPKIEFTVRLQPLNILITPEPGKILADSVSWGDFHNGVAAALRIAPGAPGVQSSWIAFNKPTELSPEHAGFLLGLGLTGHLKEMLTWHTFSYLTPKHDLTSIGVLLGLSAANLGSGNMHVTKLLAVHTPALLPTPSVDLNVSLVTQAAGLSGVGLLYLGTKNRRMAEVCLTQISRRDLVQPDLSNEHREAYTYSSAIAYGMIMLGKGSDIPADMILVKRLNVLIHGGASKVVGHRTKLPFDINLTSPAASIALGLMYLRTGRKDIAEILTIPETVLELNSIQPSFLLVRTIARALILFDDIAPNQTWIFYQIPEPLRDAHILRTKHGKKMDDAMELAHHYIVAGCCFAIALKYAGTARHEAYRTIVMHFDVFSRMAYSTGPAFDHKIKRSAVRDGLNLIALSLSMVMAGTGEISCLRRLRYSYGMYQQMMYHHGFKYGVHAATHMSIGLLFIGQGRYTLGTSDAAIACMVASFFPRFNHSSSDNKSYLQALRHLWVLAVEPRCLIARDVDTKEVVYLPVKITTKEGDEVHTTQLISPTLIPDMDKLLSIRIDTPRYWPFYLDTVAHPRHKETLLKNQTLFVKRRTAFLSYTEDPRGSRSLFVRSGSSLANDSAMLEAPGSQNLGMHLTGDLSEFITSFSNDPLFLAFADHFARPGPPTAGGEGEGVPNDERILQTYCHAALLDSIMQDKPQTLQSHLTLFLYRHMDPRSRYFSLRLQDLRLAGDFYCGKVFEKRFSGVAENNVRAGLLREQTVLGAIHVLDVRLEEVERQERRLGEWVARYAKGEVVPGLLHLFPEAKAGTMDVKRAAAGSLGEVPTQDSEAFSADREMMTRYLAWYLLRHGVPSSTLLVVLRGLARDAHNQCLAQPPPQGTADAQSLDMGIREVLHATGNRMASGHHGLAWSIKSLDEIIEAWKG